MFTYILILVSRIINAAADNILHIGAKEKNEEVGKKVGFVIFFIIKTENHFKKGNNDKLLR